MITIFYLVNSCSSTKLNTICNVEDELRVHYIDFTDETKVQFNKKDKETIREIIGEKKLTKKLLKGFKIAPLYRLVWECNGDNYEVLVTENLIEVNKNSYYIGRSKITKKETIRLANLLDKSGALLLKPHK